MVSSKPLVIDDHVAMRSFYLLLGKHSQREGQEATSSGFAERAQPPQGSSAIRELLQTPAHVLPSTSYLCSMFVQSLLISTAEKRKENKHKEEEMESEKEEEDSDEEMESGTTRPEQASGGAPSTDSTDPAMTKAQARELRRVKKLDYSWLGGLLD